MTSDFHCRGHFTIYTRILIDARELSEFNQGGIHI